MRHHRLVHQIIVAARQAAFVGGKTIPQNSAATLAEHRQRAQSITRRVPPRPAMGRRPR